MTGERGRGLKSAGSFTRGDAQAGGSIGEQSCARLISLTMSSFLDLRCRSLPRVQVARDAGQC
eukprot:4976431-Alexandrium_andersonii.AAC.1